MSLSPIEKELSIKNVFISKYVVKIMTLINVANY
jgi:hypothetical protein